MKKIIIWLFEKYAYDYWLDLQTQEENERLLKKYGTDDIEEAYQCDIAEKQQPEGMAYKQGFLDGINDDRVFENDL